MSNANLTDRQQKWFASVREGLERDTGRSLAEWVAIARTCPETGHRARLAWFKTRHGLLQNRASMVLSEAFGGGSGWSEPQVLIDSLWTDPGARAIFNAVATAAAGAPHVVQTARKSYTAWSRQVQFAALRPIRGGGAILGLAIPPQTDPKLEPRRSEPWSERLTSRLALGSAGEVDERIRVWLKAAWEGA